MQSFLNDLLRALRQSIVVRLGLTMGVVAALAFVSILISTAIADSSSGKAGAINLSGSLRMMSYRMLSEAQQPAIRHTLTDSIEQFETRLQTLTRFVSRRDSTETGVENSLEDIERRWREHIRPLARAAADGSIDALVLMQRDIPGFVSRIDQVVQMIEADLERQIRWLRGAQFILLGLMVVVSLITTWMLRKQLVRPLADLLQAAQTVKGGSFTARVQHTSGDELGQVGQAFNTMLGEIANSYASLEQKVEEKTRELTRTNQSLELLYRTSQQLAASDLTLETIRTVLRDIEKELGLGHSMLCMSENGSLPAQTLLGNLSPAEVGKLCGQHDCESCFAHAEPGLNPSRSGDQPVVFVPLDDGISRATLPILLQPGETLAPEKARIVETIGHHISNALANMRRAEEKHRLAVLEERSVIARELHDSIAQSLSYLKIQVTRLERSLASGKDASVIAGELRHGLNAAYRELRELITTFRLRIDARGFNAALQETVEEFSDKLGFRIELHNELASITLTANEEMHLLRIIREVLSNIERHAHASQTRIDIRLLADERVEIAIEDNGQGFDPASIPPNHFGVSIMRDRAQTLGGEIRFESAVDRGTRVQLDFRPNAYTPKDSA